MLISVRWPLEMRIDSFFPNSRTRLPMCFLSTSPSMEERKYVMPMMSAQSTGRIADSASSKINAV